MSDEALQSQICESLAKRFRLDCSSPTSEPFRHPGYAVFEAFQPSLLRTKLVSNIKQIGFAFGSGRIDQFALKQSNSISHLPSFSQPYAFNPTQPTHVQPSPPMQHGVASEN